MSPRNDPRDNKFTFVLTDDEKRMLEAVAQRDRRSASDWIRLAIQRAYEETEAKPPKKKR